MNPKACFVKFCARAAMRGVLLSIVLWSGAASVGYSQGAHAAAAVAPAVWPGSLGALLRQAAPDPGEAIVAVDADHRPLPKDTPLPSPIDGIAATADAYGQIAQRFGMAIAVAPPTMTIINTDLPAPQIYDGMPAGDALKLLCATLSPAQWQALTSKGGLGVSDLDTSDQRDLFQSVVGEGPMKAFPVGNTGPAAPIDITNDLPQARLRLGSHTDIELPTSDHSWRGGSSANANNAGPRYFSENGSSSKTTLDGNIIKAVVPNAPKKSDLDYSSPALRVPIPLQGLKTVGDLVYRIGGMTKIEIYADPHYADKSLLIVAGPAVHQAAGQPPTAGAAPEAATAPAGDLLHALAFCLTATCRQVGPAYVLTDDLIGVGTRRQRLADYDTLAQRMRQKPLDAAADLIDAQHYGLGDLHSYDGGQDEAPTPDEIKKAQASEFSMDTPGQFLHLTFQDLTPAQQAIAQADAAAGANDVIGGDEAHPPSLTGTLLLVTSPKLDLLVPSLPGPVEIGSYDLNSLFRPSEKMMNARMEAQQKTAQAQRKPPSVVVPPAPPLSQVMERFPRRAVLVDAHTAAQVESAVAAMQTLGLNELWLPVFTDGQALIPGTPFSATAGSDDILADARRAVKGTGIRIFPVLDLLTWGTDAPADAQGLTILGENSAQAQAQQLSQQQGDSGTVIRLTATQKRLVASPFAPSVRRPLLSLVEKLGAEPGVSGIVWRETAPSGYASRNFYQEPIFGYNLAGRLAFLRTYHADPIDLTSSTSRADTRLPNWDDGVPDQTDAWGKFRVAADDELLRSLFSEWPPVGTDGKPRPIFVQQRLQSWQGDWFGSWERSNAQLPAYHASWDRQPGVPVYPDDPAAQAKNQSRLALVLVEHWSSSNAANLASRLFDQKKKPWDGFVIDEKDDEDAGAGLKALQSLAASFAAQKHPSK